MILNYLKKQNYRNLCIYIINTFIVMTVIMTWLSFIYQLLVIKYA